jgi:hypothetical protein
MIRFARLSTSQMFSCHIHVWALSLRKWESGDWTEHKHLIYVYLHVTATKSLDYFWFLLEILLQVYISQHPLCQHYISVISWACFVGEGNHSTRKNPPTCRKSLTNFITYCCVKDISPWTGFELTTFGTNCTGSCKSNYYTVTTTMAPIIT